MASVCFLPVLLLDRVIAALVLLFAPPGLTPSAVTIVSGDTLSRVHVPIVPMSVKAPVAASMLYMETSFETEFVT